MTSESQGRPVGSDFPTAVPPVRTASTTVPPWRTDGEDVIYVESGRQALVLVRRHAETLGMRTVVVPEYLCSSMVEPFAVAGWEVVPYHLDPGLGPDLDHLVSLAEREGSAVVVLLAAYFGLGPPDGYGEVTAHLRGGGGLVVTDETHSLLDPPGVDVDFTFASLRKLLPVGDGAYVRGEHLDLLDDVAGPSDSTRWEVMDDVAEAVQGPDDDLRRRMASANEALEQVTVVRGATARTVRELEHLDYVVIRDRRRENASVLAALLDDDPGLEIVNHPTRCDVPSHLVLSVDDPRRLQSRLAARAIFCPVHWPEVDLGPERRPWRHDLISIPIDQRYGPEDMERVGREVRREVRR